MNRREQVLACQMFAYGIQSLIAAVSGRHVTAESHLHSVNRCVDILREGKYQHEEATEEPRGPETVSPREIVG